MSLREHLADWTDFDGAQYALALLLGLMSDGTDFATTAKHVFWTNNPTGNMLSITLACLVTLGALEENDNGQFRWNPEYRGSWEE